MLKKIFSKYKLFYSIDRYSFIFYFLGLFILLVSFFMNSLMSELYPNESFVDRFASLSLVLFLISEFKLTSKLNEHILESLDKNFMAIAQRLRFNIKENSDNIKSLVNIAIDLKKIDDIKYQQSLNEIVNRLNTSSERGYQAIVDNTSSKVIIDEKIKALRYIHISIFLFILITTIIWGFGSVNW